MVAVEVSFEKGLPVILATLIIMAAAAAETTGDGIVAKGSLVVGSGVVSSILTWLAAKKHADKTAVPQPCMTEKSGGDKNLDEHKEIFQRLNSLDKDMASVKATMSAKFDAMSIQLMETKEMVRQLVDRICKRK